MGRGPREMGAELLWRPRGAGFEGHGSWTTDLPMQAPSIVQYFEKKKIRFYF